MKSIQFDSKIHFKIAMEGSHDGLSIFEFIYLFTLLKQEKKQKQNKIKQMFLVNLSSH